MPIKKFVKGRGYISTKKPSSKLWFVFPDIHIPEHDEAAVACAMQAHSLLKPDYSLFLGDVLDCGIFSAHNKRTLDELKVQDYEQIELDPARNLIDNVQKNTLIKTWFLGGNHEERIERWATSGGTVEQSLFGMLNPATTLSRTLDGSKRTKFEFVPYTKAQGSSYVRIASDLVAVHGWSWAKHAAQIHLEKSRTQSVVFGHSHRHQVASSRDPWTGKVIKAFNPGTLSQLSMLYHVGGVPSDWSHGFALIYVGVNSWTEYCISINNGYCVLPDGTEIKV